MIRFREYEGWQQQTVPGDFRSLWTSDGKGTLPTGPGAQMAPHNAGSHVEVMDSTFLGICVWAGMMKEKCTEMVQTAATKPADENCG